MTKLRLRDAPHPLRELFSFAVIGFFAVVVLASFSQGVALRIAVISMGMALALVGLALILNLNGAADFYSVFSKRKTRLGIDYSDHVLLEPRFIRLIGGPLFVIGGVYFIVSAGTGPL